MTMYGARRAACLLLLTACQKPVAASAPDAQLVSVPPLPAAPVEADAAPPASLASSVDAGAACGPTQLQTDACISTHSDLTLDGARIRAWLVEHGAKPPERVPDICRESALGGEPVLVCIDRRSAVADPAMGIVGPVFFLFDLEVLAAGKQLVTVLKEPLAIGSSGAIYDDPKEMYFSAAFTVTADAIDIDAQDCATSLSALPALFTERKKMLASLPQLDAALRAQLVRATGMEEKLSAKRIGAICHAAGHYTVGPGGLLRSH